MSNTKSVVETLSSMKKRTNVDFIINGGLFWFDNVGKAHSLNLLIDEYKQSNAGVYSRYGLMTYREGGYKFDSYKWTSDLRDMIGGSPSLVIDGKININNGNGSISDSLITARHPRTAIGVNDDYFFLVTIDGRRISMPGMTINELAKYMLNLGCIAAINLDGGGSTRIEGKNGVLNTPLENRPIHNAIGIRLKTLE